MTPDQLSDHSNMPIMLGLCPEHASEFYVPLAPGESMKCPEPGCGYELVVYTTREALATAVVAGVEVAGKVRDTNQAERWRILRALAETTTALKTTLHGRPAMWVEWDVLRDSWQFLQSRGVPDPAAFDESQRSSEEAS